MYHVSERFDAAVKRSHTAAAKVEVRDKTGRKVLANTFNTDGFSLNDGAVTVKRGRGVRRSVNLTLTSSYKVFDKYLDPVLGNKLYVYRGIQYTENDYEWCPLGVFRMNSVTVEEGANTLSYVGRGNDLSDSVSENLWSAPYTIASTTNYASALRSMFADRMPDIADDCVLPDTALTTPRLVFTERDNPWETMQKLAEGFACDAYFDQRGVFTVVPVTDPLDRVPLLDLSAGQHSVRISPVSYDINMQETYNGVICRASAPWLLFPIEGSAWDDDSSSPTYRYGPMGEKPKVIHDTIAATVPQCEAAAQAELFNIIGLAEMITFENINDPRYDVGDVVRITNRRRGLSSVHVLDTLDIPLLSGSMTGTVRTLSKTVTQ